MLKFDSATNQNRHERQRIMIRISLHDCTALKAPARYREEVIFLSADQHQPMMHTCELQNRDKLKTYKHNSRKTNVLQRQDLWTGSACEYFQT